MNTKKLISLLASSCLISSNIYAQELHYYSSGNNINTNQKIAGRSTADNQLPDNGLLSSQLPRAMTVVPIDHGMRFISIFTEYSNHTLLEHYFDPNNYEYWKNGAICLMFAYNMPAVKSTDMENTCDFLPQTNASATTNTNSTTLGEDSITTYDCLSAIPMNPCGKNALPTMHHENCPHPDWDGTQVVAISLEDPKHRYRNMILLNTITILDRNSRIERNASLSSVASNTSTLVSYTADNKNSSVPQQSSKCSNANFGYGTIDNFSSLPWSNYSDGTPEAAKESGGVSRFVPDGRIPLLSSFFSLLSISIIFFAHGL